MIKILLVLAVGFGTAAGQSFSDKDFKYIISGTAISGGYGLFTLPSPHILPKGRFAAAGTYEDRSNDEPASMKYALGLGLADRAEAFVIFSSSLSNQKNDLTQGGIKINVLRGIAGEDFLGSVEMGYLQKDKEFGGLPVSARALIGRFHGGAVVGNIELFGNVGYAVGLGNEQNRFLIGAAGFMPVLPNVSVGAEVGTDHSATGANGFGMGAGIKISAFDHFQLLVAGRSHIGSSHLAPILTIGISFSSAFYYIAPGWRETPDRTPPLPSLEELEKENEARSDSP